MFVNSVIRWNKENYRIIRLHDNQVYLISLDKKTNKYMVTPKEVVDSAVSKGEISQIEDPFKAKSVLRPESRTKAASSSKNRTPNPKFPWVNPALRGMPREA